jgi:hypothetical protein
VGYTEVCRLVEGAEAEVYTVVIISAIVLVYTDSHNTMLLLCKLKLWLPQQTSVCFKNKQLSLDSRGLNRFVRFVIIIFQLKRVHHRT